MGFKHLATRGSYWSGRGKNSNLKLEKGRLNKGMTGRGAKTSVTTRSAGERKAQGILGYMDARKIPEKNGEKKGE